MEAFDKDEGYISPLDAFEAGEVENNCLKYNQLVKQPKPYLSWSHVQKPFRDKNQQNCQTMPLKFLTDNVPDSAKIIDNLWLVLPEIRAGRNGNTITETRPTSINSSAIMNVVESVSKPEYLSLSDFIRDVIDLLSGKQSETFPMLNDKIFCKNPAVLVRGLTPSAISNYCAPFLRIGSLIIELNNIEESFHFHTSVLSAKSVVCVRFVKFIKDYLHVYQTIIMLKRASIISLTSLRRFIQPYQQQIQTLWNIVQKQVFASPVLMLKNLNSFMLKIEIPCVSELLQNLLVSCASAYSKYVSDWIFRGLLGSPLEFHIVKSRTVASKDRRFWTQQFTQNQDIPKFLKSLKQCMFDTGRAINLLKELQRTSNLPSYFDYDTDLYIKFELTHEGTIKLLNTNHTKLLKFLEQNAYLQEEINQAVEAVQTLNIKGKLVEAIHSKLVERNEVECALRLETARQEKFLKFQEKRQSQMAEILESINAARLLRLQQAMDELFAEKERQAYNERKERVTLNKGYSLLQQFYGDFPDIIKHNNINSSGEGSRQQVTSSAIAPMSNAIASAGDCDMNSDDPCNKNNDIGDSNISLACPSETVEIVVPATEDQSNPPSISPCDNSVGLPVEITNQDEIPDYVPTNFEKIHCKDFKTKPVTPFSLDFKMFSPPLVPAVIPNSGESMTCGGEECDEFLTNRFLSLSVEIPLMTQHKMVNLTLLHHIVVSKQLFRHLKAFHDYLLLQNGLFGYFVNTVLIDRVKKGVLKHREEIPNQITALNHLLEEVLTAVADPDEMSFLKSMKFDAIPEVTNSERDKLSASSRSSSSTTLASTPGKPKKQELTSEFDVLNSLYLHYTVEWPLNIIFTNEFIRQYQLVFCLQMRLFRAELLLSGAAMSLKSKSCRSPQLLQLNSYRYIMLHFVQSARSYINVTVIHTSWTELVASFTKMDSLEKIYELLVRHIKSVTSNCLLGPKAQAVMKLLVNQLVVIEAFCCKLETVMNNIDWDKRETIQPVDYKRLVQSYRVFMEIQKVFVQGKFKVFKLSGKPFLKNSFFGMVTCDTMIQRNAMKMKMSVC